MGILAIYAAENAKRVVATDISSKAVANARYNVARHGVEHIVEVREGDLFAPVENEVFDVIIANFDFPYKESDTGLRALHRRLFAEIGQYLESGGRFYYQAGEVTNAPLIQSMAWDNGLQIRQMHMLAPRRGRQPIVYMFQRIEP